MSDRAIDVAAVTHRYASTVALNGVSLQVAPGSLTGLLGPNGSGKTTLFRLLATLLPVQDGTICILGHNVVQQPGRVREQLGVTFQSPALDGRLTVVENIQCHGQLYGLDRRTLHDRIEQGLARLELTERRHDRVEQLSGGLRRRVELAKGLLHRPGILLLDEPSTGLDVLSRRRFWDLVDNVRRTDGTTVVVSTHLMDEAERCDELFLLHQGQVVLQGTPAELRRRVDGERLTLRCQDTQRGADVVRSVYGQDPECVGETLTLRISQAGQKLPQLLDQLGDSVLSVEVAQATLDDVFVQATGRGLEDTSDE